MALILRRSEHLFTSDRELTVSQSKNTNKVQLAELIIFIGVSYGIASVMLPIEAVMAQSCITKVHLNIDESS